MKKVILFLIIAFIAFYYMSGQHVNMDEWKQIEGLHNIYQSYESYTSHHLLKTSINTSNISTLATSFNRAIIVSNGSNAYLIFKSGTYFAIRSETSYIITGRFAVAIWTHGTKGTTKITTFPIDFSNMNLVDPLINYFHTSPKATEWSCTSMFFIQSYSGPATYTLNTLNKMTIFYLDHRVTITIIPASATSQK